MDKSILIMTHEENGSVKLPHLTELKKSNPDVNVHVVVGEDSGFGKHYDWKNSDQQLRKWWKNNSSKVSGDVIYIIEWDTLVTCELPEITDEYDLVGKRYLKENVNNRGKWKIKRQKDPSWNQDNWMWWKEVNLLNLKETEEAAGLVSFGFMICKRWALDAICDCKFDEIYKKSIQNELRFPTCAKLSGARIGEIHLPFVDFDNVVPTNDPGIYHGVPK